MTYELGSIGEGKSAAELKNIIKSRQQAYSEVRDYLVGNNRQATQLFNERKQKDRANQIYRNTRLSRYVDTITGVIASPGYQRYSFKGDIPSYADKIRLGCDVQFLAPASQGISSVWQSSDNHCRR